MTNAQIRRHFKRAMDNGFTKEYIRDVLVKKGYDRKEVNKVYLLLPRQGEAEEPKKPTNLLPLFGALFVIALIVIFFAANKYYSTEYEQKVESTQEEVQRKIDQIGDISADIDVKQKQIDGQLDSISQLDTSVQEKEEIIQRQVVELKRVNEQITQERAKIKILLLDLLNLILET